MICGTCAGGMVSTRGLPDPHLLVPKDHTHVCKQCLVDVGRILADCTEETEPDYEAMVADYSNRFKEFGVTGTRRSDECQH